MCRIRCSPPGNLGNHAGRLAVYKPFTGSPKVLLITTQGRPTHLTCGQTIMRIIIPRPRSWRKGKLLPLSGQNASLKANNTSHRPTNKWEAVCVRLVMALFPKFVVQILHYESFSRSLRRECTRMAGIHFSSCKANVSFSPFTPQPRKKAGI